MTLLLLGLLMYRCLLKVVLCDCSVSIQFRQLAPIQLSLSKSTITYFSVANNVACCSRLVE